MSDTARLSLFTYLDSEKNLSKLEKGKDFSAYSVEAMALLVAKYYHETPGKLFFLFSTIYEAESFVQFLGDYVKDDELFFFPYDEIFRTSAIGASPEMTEERLLALASTRDRKPSILVAHCSSASLKILPKRKYDSAIIDFSVGDMIRLKDIQNRLITLGYQNVDHVTQINQYSLRGGILDVFDAAYQDPFRIEFFGDEIDDIRMFHVNDELSFSHIKEIELHPASLRLFTEEEKEEGLRKISEELKEIEPIAERLAFDDLKERIDELSNQSQFLYLADSDLRFYPYFESEDATILSYLKGYEKYCYDIDECRDEFKSCRKKEKEYFTQSVKRNNSVSLERVFVNDIPSLDDFILCKPSTESDSFVLRECTFHSTSYIESNRMLEEYLRDGYKIRIFLPEPNFSNYQNYLNEKEIPFSITSHELVMLIDGRIDHGFEIPKEKHVYLSVKEIYGVSNHRSRFLSRYKEAKLIRRYEDLKEGDYVVHEIHGVGRYSGVVTIDGLEYLKIQYADNQVFYLPLSQYRLIRKYASREGYQPTLDRMGGSTWSRKKSKIRSRISYLADQLIALYSERNARPGFAFPSEKELIDGFEKTFSYPYTPGQLSAIHDVEEDMESSHPMDRLIAGDVGFGKTEIAFVAAFKAILAHKQVCLLCPTTILSQQHYKVAVQRFRDYGIRLAIYNRFLTKKEQIEVRNGLKSGEIDFVIGTHSLLSDEIEFNDLGLFIVDEEQKFGVAHKEKMKQRARNVDCLTLTATPIPRTMQMSLLGIRSLSLLSEAPVNRMPVKTYVAKQDDGLIEEVIQKELDRHGQVYYLHNKISSIQKTAEKLQKKFPEHKISVVHAKMTQDEIEDSMNDFYQSKSDILVCTSIIESGLDIPNVNTIIVEDSDHFGLAQLYQIKGRVGRSDRLAYAYFFFKNKDRLTDEARKRLKALKEFTELGSGYKIAMQDLNIRGAGDILGSEQAGFVDALGYDAYMQLLEEVVKEKTLQTSAFYGEYHPRFELSFTLDAHIPEQYGNKEQRITMYRELSDCNDDKALNAFASKLRDVYGPYPEEVENLLVKKKIENFINSNDVDSFSEGLGFYTMTMSESYSRIDRIYLKLDELLRPLAVKLRFKTNKNRFEFMLTKTREYLADLLFLVQKLEEAKK